MKYSYISKKPILAGEQVRGSYLREGIFNLILKKHPGFSSKDYITLEELNQFRRYYITSLLLEEKGQLEKIDSDVLKAISSNSILSENIEENIIENLTAGEKLADKIASFGGSWKFIIVFFSFILIWLAINIYAFFDKPFDPYPFILLNLLLSCIAAIQAPIIMMSQNRQEQKDRKRSEQDYKVNLKAELEIKILGEKIDHMLVHHNRKLLEIQEVQTDYLQDLMKEIKKH